MTYHICENCGAALDPGERCDCLREEGAEVQILACQQPPIIFENLYLVQQNLDEVIAQVSAFPQDDESLKQVKQIRANLAKDFDELEQKRKTVKKQVLEPYEKVEKKYKEAITTPYNKAQDYLKNWVDTYQNGLKRACEEKLKDYFLELRQEYDLDFLDFGDCGITVDMAMARQKEPRKAMDTILAFVQAVRQDVDTILKMENSEMILEEYRRSKDIAEAIQNTQTRIQAQEQARAYKQQQQERARQQETHRAQLTQAAPELAPPKEELVSVSFTATGTLSALKAMKAYARNLGITFADK